MENNKKMKTLHKRAAYIFTDYQGNILSVFDENANKVFDAEYDAWGKQTIRKNDIGLIRGYTGHEMLDDFGVINMNGRLYDPALGVFFSPDNYVQTPTDAQSYNRYTYCLNNPLKYTDPRGEFWELAISAAIGGVMNSASHGFRFNANGLGYFVTGAAAAAVATGVAGGVNVAMTGGNFWQGAAGMSGGVSSTGFLAGAVSGASAGLAGGLVSGVGNSLVEGNCLGKSLLDGLTSGGFGALSGGVTGGLAGGADALDMGTSYWTGKAELDLMAHTRALDAYPLISPWERARLLENMWASSRGLMSLKVASWGTLELAVIVLLLFPNVASLLRTACLQVRWKKG